MADSEFIPIGKTSPKFIDIAGRRFGRLTVIRVVRRASDRALLWLCACDCGKEFATHGSKLTSGHCVSCGCFKATFIGDKFRRHGLSRTSTHNIWCNMRSRCNNPRNTAYKDYGGRGIKVDPRWETFDNFLADMGECPPGKEIDRENNNGNYEPGNCRWVTSQINSNNRRSSHAVEYRGKSMTVANLARATGVPASRIHSRLSSGYTVEDAVNSPTHVVRAAQKYEYRGQQLTVMELARLSGKNWSTVSLRLKAGMSVEDAITLPPSKVKGVGPRSRYNHVTGERRWKS